MGSELRLLEIVVEMDHHRWLPTDRALEALGTVLLERLSSSNRRAGPC